MVDQPADRPGSIDDEALTATQGLIARLSSQLDQLKSKQRELKEMLTNVFDNDTTLAQAETVAKEAKQTATDRKKDLNQTQEVMDIKMKITDITEEVKMVQDSLNTHLLNYFQMTSSTIIDLPDGTEREIDLKARLKPPRS